MTRKPTYEELERRLFELEKQVANRKAAKALLADDRETLSRILQSMTVPALVINKDHVIIHCNKAFENLTGIPADEFIGTQNQWMTFYPKERPVMADFIVDNAPSEKLTEYYGERLQKSALIEGAYEAEGFFPDLGDEGKWLFFTAAPLIDADGKIIGAIETLQDITERKRADEALRKSEKRLRILLDFVPYPMVVFNLEGKVTYLNPAFAETFGWTFNELRGKRIPYVPPELERETKESIKELFEKNIILRFETKRLTKDGRVLDVIMRGALFTDNEGKSAGELVILRDITKEKRMARVNKALLRISRALPEYPDLGELLDYISEEVKMLLEAEGAVVLLLDEEREELFSLGAAYDDTDAEKKVKEIRFPLDKVVAGKVIKNGEPIIISDASRDGGLYQDRDEELGYETRNLIEVPLTSVDRIIGVLCAINKKEGEFDQSHVELLNLIAGSVALSIENARFSEQLISAYRNNAALLRISTALPKYPDLEELLYYISSEVRRLLDTQGAVVAMMDQESQEMFFLGAAYDDPAIEERLKFTRFPVNQLAAGEVLKSGKPKIISGVSEGDKRYKERDQQFGYETRNLLLVPLKSHDRVIGVLCTVNKKQGDFNRTNTELLSLVAGTVALSIENVRYSEELKRAYMEVTSLNRAKDKVINHLSHELKTPLSVLSPTFNILSKKLKQLPEETWKSTIERGLRNVERLLQIQYQVDDIMQDKHFKTYNVMNILLDECADSLEALVTEEVAEGALVSKVRERIEEVFGPKDLTPKVLELDAFVNLRLDDLKKQFAHREVEIIPCLESTPPLYMPVDPLQKVIDGLVKNAVENTPDQGKIEVAVKRKGEGTELVVHDYGVGITSDAQRRIFEGFFTTQESLHYSSKRPFDFNAGGRGADLLRMKIFSERYNFKIEMSSDRCRFISLDSDVCPGRISDCEFCAGSEDCHASGGTIFTVYFPPVPLSARIS